MSHSRNGAGESQLNESVVPPATRPRSALDPIYTRKVETHSAGGPVKAFVCSGPRCARRGSRFVRQALDVAVRERGLSDAVQVLRTNGGCLGQCEFGPNVTVYPQGVRYFGVTPLDAADLAAEHFAAGRIVARLQWSPERFGERSG